MVMLDRLLTKEDAENMPLNVASCCQSRPANRLTATSPAKAKVNRQGQSVAMEQPQCPRCGSSNVRPKGYAYRKSTGENSRVWRCTKCGYRFIGNTLRARRRSDLPDDITIKYLKGFKSLNSLKDNISLSQSVSTIHRRIVKDASTYPSWRDLLKRDDVRKAWGRVMGLDTTGIKIKGSTYTFLFVADIPSRLPLAYKILRSREAKLVVNVLREIRASGYRPKLIVTDLAEELLKAVSEVFPGVPVQRCLFHLKYWLKKELPTKRKSKRMDEATRKKIRMWKEVIKVILSVALAENEAERRKQMNKLLRMNVDGKARDVIRRFIEKLHYCHTLNEIRKLGCELNHLYNNVCENAMREVKDLMRRMRGFKNLRNTAAYIKVLWYTRTMEILKGIPLDEEKHVTNYNVPLILFEGENVINLRELSNITGINVENLIAEAERSQMTVIGEYALRMRYINEIRKTLHREKPKTIGEASKILNLDVNLLTQLLPQLQISPIFHQINPKHAEIKYPTNLDQFIWSRMKQPKTNNNQKKSRSRMKQNDIGHK